MKRIIMAVALSGMMLTTTSVLAQSTPPASAQGTQHVEQMQAHMKEMQAQMDKIHRTQDPKERQRLLQEHLKSMQQGMQVIHSASGDTLEHRVHMMEMMMDQMLKSQEVAIEPLPHGFKDKY